MQVNSIASNQSFQGLKVAKDVDFKKAIMENSAILEAAKKYNINVYETKNTVPLGGMIYDVVFDITQKAKKLFQKPTKGSIKVESRDFIRHGSIEKQIKNITSEDIEKAVNKETCITKKIRNTKLMETLKLGRDEIMSNLANKGIFF